MESQSVLVRLHVLASLVVFIFSSQFSAIYLSRSLIHGNNPSALNFHLSDSMSRRGRKLLLKLLIYEYQTSNANDIEEEDTENFVSQLLA